MYIHVAEAINVVAKNQSIQRRKAQRLLVNAFARGKIEVTAVHWSESIFVERGGTWIPLTQGLQLVVEEHAMPASFWNDAVPGGEPDTSSYWHSERQMPAQDLPIQRRGSTVKKFGPAARVKLSECAFLPTLDDCKLQALLANDDFVNQFDKPGSKARGPKKGKIYPQISAILSYLSIDSNYLSDEQPIILARLVARLAGADIEDPSIKREIFRMIADQKEIRLFRNNGDSAPV